jgi:hypothetical protein
MGIPDHKGRSATAENCVEGPGQARVNGQVIRNEPKKVLIGAGRLGTSAIFATAIFTDGLQQAQAALIKFLQLPLTIT